MTDKVLGTDQTGDGRAEFYLVNVSTATDYYPFGSAMPGRSLNPGDYRFGFNGKENDANGEWGARLVQDYGFRLYNPGIGKFLSVDPLSPDYPELTPYQFASNTPVAAIDLDGQECLVVTCNYFPGNDQPIFGLDFDPKAEPIDEGIWLYTRWHDGSGAESHRSIKAPRPPDKPSKMAGIAFMSSVGQSRETSSAPEEKTKYEELPDCLFDFFGGSMPSYSKLNALMHMNWGGRAEASKIAISTYEAMEKFDEYTSKYKLFTDYVYPLIGSGPKESNSSKRVDANGHMPNEETNWRFKSYTPNKNPTGPFKLGENYFLTKGVTSKYDPLGIKSDTSHEDIGIVKVDSLKNGAVIFHNSAKK